jgi:hypothetical protein
MNCALLESITVQLKLNYFNRPKKTRKDFNATFLRIYRPLTMTCLAYSILVERMVYALTGTVPPRWRAWRGQQRLRIQVSRLQEAR